MGGSTNPVAQLTLPSPILAAMAKLLVIGHSFVRRLRLPGRRTSAGQTIGDITRHASRAVIRGFGGKRLTSLRRLRAEGNPSVIVVDVSTNDLASPMCCPLQLADPVVSVARQFAAVPSVQRVVSVDAKRRVVVGVRRDVRADFNDARTAYNAA